MTAHRHSLLLCAVPRHCWPGAPGSAGRHGHLQRLLVDLATLERRIAKGANIEEELVRYTAVCAEIEGEVLLHVRLCHDRAGLKRALAADHFPAARVGPEYLDLLDQLRVEGAPVSHLAKGRLGATVVGPDKVAAHVRAVRRAAIAGGFARERAIARRLTLIAELAAARGCGFVEVHDPFESVDAGQTTPAPGTAWTDLRALRERFEHWRLRLTPPPSRVVRAWLRQLDSRAGTQGVPADEVEQPDWARYTAESDNRGEFLVERLRGQIERALAGNGVVNANNQRHEVLTRVLHDYICDDGRWPWSTRAADVRVIYGDGSEARPFPLRSVPRTRFNWTHTHVLNLALISMRHPELDELIDINWFRNIEVPANRTLAHADEYCYATSLAQFAELRATFAGERLLLNLFHTGFEPAIVGFYRALTTLLTEEHRGLTSAARRLVGSGEGIGVRPWLVNHLRLQGEMPGSWVRVVPKFFKGERIESGARWPD